MLSDAAHKAFTEVSGFCSAVTGLYISTISTIKHGEEVFETVLRKLGLRDEVERSGTERRKQHMDLLELPQFVNDGVALAKLIQEDWEVVAPQNPALVAALAKWKADGEKLLGIVNPPTA
jgi:hypothetical protein